MSVLITALDGPTIHTDPSAELLAKWAWERHASTCPECAHGLEYCPAGRRYLAATAPKQHDDYPTYPAI